MTNQRSSEKAKVAAEAWRLLAEYFFRSAHLRVEVLQKFGLTPNEAKALGALSAAEGTPMGALAEKWACDASNATWIVDRLERQGLAERRNLPSDRRVKLVVLTDRGVEVSKRLHREMLKPPPDVMRLDIADLETLRGALAKLNEVSSLPPVMEAERHVHSRHDSA
jgi:DNA-binding MarR family transcriptional regulator